MRDATDSCIDIPVDQTAMPVQRVLEQLERFGLMAKSPKILDGRVALGLRLDEGESGELKFGREMTLSEIVEEINIRQLFSIYRKLVGRYPVARWLRTT